MTTSEFLPHLESYIKTQTEMAARWNGKGSTGEDEALIAQERMEAAEELLNVIAEYDI
jgi:hypothetical protein